MVKKQLTLAANDFERFRKPTRRERFLAEMNQVVPWAELVALLEPYYPKAKSAGGRPAVGLERMLRIHCLQLWFDLSDPAVEEALYDSRAMRTFVGIDLGREPVPDETTVMRFRHLLEEHQLGGKIFDEVGRLLSEILPRRRGRSRRLSALRPHHGMGYGRRRRRAPSSRRHDRRPRRQTVPLRQDQAGARQRFCERALHCLGQARLNGSIFCAKSSQTKRPGKPGLFVHAELLQFTPRRYASRP